MTERESGSWPLGPLLQRARRKSGFSVREAARAAGFSPTTWSSLESGTRLVDGEREPAKPRAENIIAAAGVLGVDVDEALRLAGYNARVHNPERRGRPTVSQQELAHRISRLTEKHRQAVSDVVEAMLEPDDVPAGDEGSPNGEMSVAEAADETSAKFVEDGE